MNQPKLYYFMQNSHHYLISRIDEDSFWIFDMCTIRYTSERYRTLDEAIEQWKKYYKTLYTFGTYRELFAFMLQQEMDFDIMDLFWDKNLVERESLHQNKVEKIIKEITDNHQK